MYQFTNAQEAENNSKGFEEKISQKSISILLSFEGKGNVVKDIKVALLKLYEGKAKLLNDINSTRGRYPIKIKAINAQQQIIYTGYFDNPLVDRREVYTENGQTADNFEFILTEGSINVRFPIVSNKQDVITLYCYQLDGDEHETLLKTIALNQK